MQIETVITKRNFFWKFGRLPFEDSNEFLLEIWMTILWKLIQIAFGNSDQLCLRIVDHVLKFRHFFIKEYEKNQTNYLTLVNFPWTNFVLKFSEILFLSSDEVPLKIKMKCLWKFRRIPVQTRSVWKFKPVRFGNSNEFLLEIQNNSY